MKYTDSPLCTFCQKQLETVEHLFWECELVNIIWHELEDWLQTVQVTINFASEYVLFGIKGANNNPINVIILLIKQYI